MTAEFGLQAKQDVHFMMTTGYVTQGQSALYLAETNTGQFGVYTMGPGQNGNGVVIRRHDTTYRLDHGAGPTQLRRPSSAAWLVRSTVSGVTDT